MTPLRPSRFGTPVRDPLPRVPAPESHAPVLLDGAVENVGATRRHDLERITESSDEKGEQVGNRSQHGRLLRFDRRPHDSRPDGSSMRPVSDPSTIPSLHINRVIHERKSSELVCDTIHTPLKSCDLRGSPQVGMQSIKNTIRSYTIRMFETDNSVLRGCFEYSAFVPRRHPGHRKAVDPGSGPTASALRTTANPSAVPARPTG